MKRESIIKRQEINKRWKYSLFLFSKVGRGLPLFLLSIKFPSSHYNICKVHSVKVNICTNYTYQHLLTSL